MIESHLDTEIKEPKLTAPLPSTNSSTPKTTIHAANTPPSSPKKSNNKMLYAGLFVFLFVCAVLGGYFAYQTINKSSQLDVTQSEDTEAWRPVSVTGTCTGGRVIGNNEQVPYSFNFTFILANGGRSATLDHTFNSSPVGSGHKIDDDFTWSSLGSNGDTFAQALRTNDRVTWKVKVNYVIDGETRTENHEGFFNIFDTNCSSSTPTPTPSASASPSPSATPTRTPSPTPSPTATATSSPIPTSTPPIGGEPTPTPTASPTPTPTVTSSPTTSPTNPPQSQSTPNPTNPPTAVANEESLPKAGIEDHAQLLIALGIISLIISGVFAFSKKKIV